ncbi:MAG: 2-deoxy-5-keto-D-gluconate 6-phosphate aldolase domain-containing protein [Acidimicrobiales bacterium]
MALGYDKNLYILAFDHRGSFQKSVLGIKGRPPTSEEDATISDLKTLVAEGFETALEQGAPADACGVLVDEQYGAEVVRRARENGWIFAMPVEKSGQDTFDFEYGDEFGKHIEEFDTTFSKVLVRYNPADPDEDRELQAGRLRQLSDWLHERDRKFLFELLVPANDEQLALVEGDTETYDSDVRPGLMIEVITELQNAGVEPDIWKIEGIDRREDCERIAETVRRNGRDGVGCVVLGRGADAEKVEHWLRQGARVPGYLGLAIGRTIWFDPLKAFVDGTIDREPAAAQVAANYRRYVDVYAAAAGS